MFKITAGKGFHLTFDNGWTVSVQWGPSNYCSNQATDFSIPREIAANCGEYQSNTAEVAAWTENAQDDDPIRAYIRADEVADLIHEISQR
jgi:hypothetical protein